VFQASDFLTVALLVALEGLLSADNAMVLAVLVLGLPKREQHKALRYGIIGAFAFRTIATLLAVYLIRLGWVKLAGAAYLLYLAVKHFFLTDAEDRRKAPRRSRPWDSAPSGRRS
jgi:predicted tellurium resistance membrane protein TerC